MQDLIQDPKTETSTIEYLDCETKIDTPKYLALQKRSKLQNIWNYSKNKTREI